MNCRSNVRHHHCFRLTSIFSHLGWGWACDGCYQHKSLLHHMLLHSQQIHIILHHTFTPLFPRASHQLLSSILTSPTTPNSPSAIFTCPNHLSLLFPQLNRKVFNSTHFCHHTTRLSILPPNFCHVSRYPLITYITLLVSMPMFLLYTVQQISCKLHKKIIPLS